MENSLFLHSWELATAVDGPGTRLVLFFKGCPLRCVFCHNPDTWVKSGNRTSFAEIEGLITRYKPIFQTTGGGITLSGGEVFYQKDALHAIVGLAKKAKVNVCLDTSSAGSLSFNDADLIDILKQVDIILLDIKGFDETSQLEITGKKFWKEWERFAHLAIKTVNNVRLRFVLVPGITNTEKFLKGVKTLHSSLNEYAKKNGKSPLNLDILPFHQLGKTKYEELGLPYKLSSLPSASNEDVTKAKQILGI